MALSSQLSFRLSLLPAGIIGDNHYAKLYFGLLYVISRTFLGIKPNFYFGLYPNYQKDFTKPHVAVSYKIVFRIMVACAALESLVSARLCPQNASVFMMQDSLLQVCFLEIPHTALWTEEKKGHVVGLM